MKRTVTELSRRFSFSLNRLLIETFSLHSVSWPSVYTLYSWVLSSSCKPACTGASDCGRCLCCGTVHFKFLLLFLGVFPFGISMICRSLVPQTHKLVLRESFSRSLYFLMLFSISSTTAVCTSVVYVWRYTSSCFWGIHSFR